MKHIILTAVLMTAISAPAMAANGYLRDVVSDNPDVYIGENCYEGIDDIKLFYIRSNGSFTFDDVASTDECPDHYTDSWSNADHMCQVWMTSSDIYVCAKGFTKDSCPFISAWEDIDWHSYGRNTNQVRQLGGGLHIESVGDYRCIANPTYDYGCKAGYYKSGGGDDSSMICSQCPSPGTSEIGNTEISACYISPHTFNTDDTGTYTVSGTCYYN